MTKFHTWGLFLMFCRHFSWEEVDCCYWLQLFFSSPSSSSEQLTCQMFPISWQSERLLMTRKMFNKYSLNNLIHCWWCPVSFSSLKFVWLFVFFSLCSLTKVSPPFLSLVAVSSAALPSVFVHFLDPSTILTSILMMMMMMMMMKVEHSDPWTESS